MEKELKLNVTAAELAAARVRVYGKAQNRTALGIINAYLVQYPHVTLEELKKAFPDNLNKDDDMFRTRAEYDALVATGNEWYVKGQGYFVKDDEWLTLGDGEKVAFVRIWQGDSLLRLAEWAKQYKIVVADFEASKQKGVKGSYELEYLNGYVPPVPTGKKKIPAWLWALLGLLVIGAIAAAFLLGNSGKKVETVEKTVVVHDTLYVQQLAEIEKNFNAAEFEVGKAELSDEAKLVLHDLGKLMQQNADLRVSIEGHTSAEGTADFNQKLSEDRAQAAVDFLTQHESIDASRLAAKGYGSSKLKNADDPKAQENRRTEFVVIE